MNDVSPAKKPRGRPAGEKKTPVKAKAEKKAKSPKSPRASRKAAPKKSESTEKEASESLSSEKKAPTPASGEKRGRGRPRKDATPAKAATKAKAGSGDSSSEASKPATRKSTSAHDKGDSRRGRSPRGRSAGPAAGGALFQMEEHQLIGAKIKKKFNDKWYEGEVVMYDPKMCYYKVQQLSSLGFRYFKFKHLQELVSHVWTILCIISGSIL